MSTTMTVTIGEFAELHGTDYQTAAGTVRFLVQQGAVKENGTRPAKSGKGKPSTLYVVPTEVTLTFKSPLTQGELFTAPVAIAEKKEEPVEAPTQEETHPKDISSRLDFAEVA